MEAQMFSIKIASN